MAEYYSQLYKLKLHFNLNRGNLSTEIKRKGACSSLTITLGFCHFKEFIGTHHGSLLDTYFHRETVMNFIHLYKYYRLWTDINHILWKPILKVLCIRSFYTSSKVQI